MPVNFLLVFFSVILLNTQLCLLLRPLYWEFPRPVPGQWSTRRTHRAQHMSVLMANTYYTRRRQSRSARVNGTWTESREGQGWTSKSPLPGGHTGCTYFLQQWIMTTHGKHCLPRTVNRDSVSRVFIGVWSHIFSYHIPKFQMPRRKADVQPEPPCSHKQFRYSEPLIIVTQQLGNSMSPPEIQLPRGSPWAKLARKSLKTAVSGLCHLLSPFTSI